MNIPPDLKYTQNDEWIRQAGEAGLVGITDYAQDQLSDIVYVEVTASEGDSLGQGEAFGAVESVKAASDVYMPVGGQVLEINTLLEDTPEAINTDPYGDAWIIKIQIADATELEALMDASAYEKYCQEREN